MTEPAATMEWLLTVTPGRIVARAPTQAPSSMVIGLTVLALLYYNQLGIATDKGTDFEKMPTARYGHTESKYPDRSRRHALPCNP
jgi:hypothetical protein